MLRPAAIGNGEEWTMAKPKVSTRCPAGRDDGRNVKTVEVSSRYGGTLVRFAEDEGSLVVDLYRADDSVVVLLPTLPDIPWVQCPTVKGAEIGHGRVAGVVDVTFTDDGKAFVRTDAHINDAKPAVTYGGTDYLIALHMERQSDGTWQQERDHSRFAISKRTRVDQAPGVRATTAILFAAAALLRREWTPELNRRAAYARAAQRANHALTNYREAKQAAEDTMMRLGALRRVMRDNR